MQLGTPMVVVFSSSPGMPVVLLVVVPVKPVVQLVVVPVKVVVQPVLPLCYEQKPQKNRK